MMKPPEVSHFRGLHHIDCDFAFSNESAWNHSTHLFELGEAFCAPSEQKFFNFFENKKSRLF